MAPTSWAAASTAVSAEPPQEARVSEPRAAAPRPTNVRRSVSGEREWVIEDSWGVRDERDRTAPRERSRGVFAAELSASARNDSVNVSVRKELWSARGVCGEEGRDAEVVWGGRW